jgi:NitT/TauT family transport system substrate-binding protein
LGQGCCACAGVAIAATRRTNRASSRIIMSDSSRRHRATAMVAGRRSWREGKARSCASVGVHLSRVQHFACADRHVFGKLAATQHAQEPTMMSPTRRRILLLAAGAGAASPVMAPHVAAQSPRRRVRFCLDWTWQSAHSGWTLAADRGFFAEAGLDVQIDRGFGSGDTMTKVAAGTYDIGFADTNLLLKFNHENPNAQLTSVFVLYDASPNAAIFLKSAGIERPKDLEGRKISVTDGEGTRLLFPIFARANQLDLSKIELLSVTAQLRDTMVVQRRADATLGFLTTTALNMVGAGVPRGDIAWLQYNRWGVELYSSGLVVRKDYAERNPEAVSAFVVATIRGLRAMIAEPAAAMASLKRREPLIDETIEISRNELINEVALMTPHVRANGVSSVDKARFERSAAQVAEAFDLSIRPPMDFTYTERFLPADRKIV